MTLFQDLSLVGQSEDGLIADAGRRVIMALERLPGNVARSLCEVLPDGDDYKWLSAWARQLSSWRADAWLSTYQTVIYQEGSPHHSRRCVFGLLLLLLSAEAARRDAHEGEVWAAVRGHFGARCQGLLFPQGQPSLEAKEAMEAAAHEFNLRNVFGVVGTQNYYLTVYLQFGFTRRGIVRLPSWLVGYHSESIKYLFGAQGTRRDLASDSFRQLWNALRQFRGNNVTEAHVRGQLSHNPWVLPEWVEDILREARAHQELVGPGNGDETADEDSLGFFTGPWFEWPSSEEPRFRCDLANLAMVPLTARRYDIVVGGKVLTSLYRQDEGNYSYQDAFTLSPTDPTQMVELVDDHDQPLRAQEAILWDPEGEIEAYDAVAGRHLDAWDQRFDTRKAYFLVTASDLELQPMGRFVWASLGAGTRRVWRITQDWPSGIQLTLNGEVLWEPLVGSAKKVETPGWVRSVSVRSEPPELWLGDEFRLHVSGIPPGAEMTWLRVNAQARDFDVFPGLVRSSPLVADPQIAVRGRTEVMIGFRLGAELAIWRREVPVGVKGVARFTDAGWQVQSSNETLDAREAARTQFRLFLPIAWHSAEPALMEGTTFTRGVGRSSRPLTFGRLGGFGASVSVYEAPYSATSRPVPIARTVIDRGEVARVGLLGDTLCVFLKRPIELDDDFRIIAWRIGFGVTELPIESSGADFWMARSPWQETDDLIVGISYKGERVGAWWPPTLATLLAGLTRDSQPAGVTAGLIRWFRLPIAQAAIAQRVRAWTDAYSGDAAAVWWGRCELPLSLEWNTGQDEWWATLREVFWDWKPSAPQTEVIVLGFSGEQQIQPLLAMVRALDSHPPLLPRLLRQWPKTCPPGITARQVQSLLAGVPEDSKEAALVGQVRRVCEDAAADMRCDPVFVRRLTDRGLRNDVSPLGEIDQRNLKVALGAQRFRRYYLLRLLAQPGIGA